jgi:voltage-dependent potassium channel beta subunit
MCFGEITEEAVIVNYRKLGRTGLRVSEISLGSWLTYGNATEADAAEKTIDRAYELGINFFDTANAYARGEAERVVGKILDKYPRESYVLATKVFFPMGEGPNDRGLSRKHVLESANASLKRLGKEYVDILYCHRPDPETPVYETLRAFDDLMRQGKVLYMGVSEWSAEQIREALHIADARLFDRLVVNQPQYSMLYRNIEEEIIPLGEKEGVGQVVFSPLAQGVLTGKYKPGQALPEGSRATDPKQNMWIGNWLKDETLNRVVQLEGIAAELGMPLSRLALAWVLRKQNVASALVGATRVPQIEENAAASGVTLEPDVLAAIDAILGEA